MLDLNRVYLGDCLEVMKSIEDKSIDMVLCDLPYGTTKCKWDVVIPFDLLWEQYNRIIKESGVVLLFGMEPFSSFLRISNIDSYKYDWVWIKNRSTGATSSKVRPLSCVENISVFYKERCIYNPIMVARTENELKRLSKDSSCQNSKENGIGFNNIFIQKRENLSLKYPRRDLYIKTVFNRGKEKVAHPTQKPVELCEYFIKTYTNEGGIILDNCAGSGTTGVAARNLKRDFILIEKESKYFNIAESRLRGII